MSKLSLLSFGEVLWDLFPTGPVVGGAPLNVAWHAQQLGLSSRMISRVGEDKEGHELISFLKEKGLANDFVQVDHNYPTGRVIVTLKSNDSPVYEIVHPVAWDFIQLQSEAKLSAAGCDAFVFGSLACRSDKNKKTLYALLEETTLPVFDVNLRAPFFSKRLISDLLKKARIVKMNDEELELISGWKNLKGNEQERIAKLRHQYHHDVVIVTKGGKGAVCCTTDGFYSHPGYKINVRDTVGSGDAFLAGFVSQYLQLKPLENCLEFAGAMGAFVATQKGATPSLDLKQISILVDDKNGT